MTTAKKNVVASDLKPGMRILWRDDEPAKVVSVSPMSTGSLKVYVRLADNGLGIREVPAEHEFIQAQ